MKTNTKKIIAYTLLSLALPALSFAVNVNDYTQPSPEGSQVLVNEGLAQVINNLINLIIWPIAVGIVIILFIIAGLKFITAQGEVGKIAEARKFVLWGVVGVIVLLVAFSVIRLVQLFFAIF